MNKLNNIVLGLDPAIKNFGYCVYDADSNVSIENGILDCTINKIDDGHPDQVLAFTNRIMDLISTHGISLITAERFQARGVTLDIQIECINQMLGIISLCAVNLGVKYKFVYASHWKNEVNKKLKTLGCFLIDPKNKRAKTETGINVYKNIRCTPHELDAALIASYGAEYVNANKEYYKSIVSMNSIEKLVRSIELATTGKLNKKIINWI